MLSDFVAFGALIITVVSFWVTVLIIVPSVARVRVQWQAAEVRDRVVNAIFDDQIDLDNPRARDVLRYCHMLEAHSRELTLTKAFATLFANRKASDRLRSRRELRTEAVQRESAGKSTAHGDVLLRSAERRLDHIVGFYLIRGSSLWWLLVPTQHFTRFLSHRNLPSAPHLSHAIDQPRPTEMATAVREGQHGVEEPLNQWRLGRHTKHDHRDLLTSV